MSAGTDSPLFPGKFFISTVLEALETKSTMAGALGRRYLMRAAMAGIIIGLLYGAHYGVIAAFDQVTVGDGTLYQLGRLVAAVTFGWALVFIYYSRSELLTSNMMIVTIGAYHRRTTWGRALRLLGLCYVGNFVGGLLVALLVRFSTLAEGATLAQMVASVEHKLAFVTDGPTGWADLVVRAVLCNFCINLAMLLVYNGLIKDDLTKSLVMIVAVFIFAFLGLEHSVANTVLFTIVGLQEGIDVGLAAGNVGLALIGNFVGGGLLIGLYYAYVNDDSRWLRNNPPAS
ncbi:formate/nitrite transporter family protein [Cellulomonas wangsupingiae]|uniref:Formate/nitrite transporter family protein n=1 Tax=Cellulomonas wangsupingiae TaxID=2968085 RepID=A0ABY5K9U0_9CELL|nr:formate/nitrite transporter family protein [Cellulomonas wangsupingiae]MCC2335337.1 formate/nitrite transporter family protein [Cellulomonas wangsupingiae]UUI66528.1 formate/nitrite transporter family protein [Cellulomonas wangsupingiae]